MERWIDVDPKIGFRFLFEGITEKIRSINDDDVIVTVYDKPVDQVNSREIAFCKFQYLNK